MSDSHQHNGQLSPFIELDRSDWAALAPTMTAPLTQTELVELRGLGDTLDLQEVEEVYLPLSRLLNLYAEGAQQLHRATTTFLGASSARTPFVIGIAGSVAVGKSTVSRLLRELMSRWEGTPRVDLVTTDGFLFPNAELERRGIMDRKGFPESYDVGLLLRFLSAVKSGLMDVQAPLYSHLTYDVLPDQFIEIDRPDILIFEGINVLQPGELPKDGKIIPFLSDFFDFSIYVDAEEDVLREWYVARFMRLRETAFRDKDSFFHRFSELSEDAAKAVAIDIWENINLKNLRENILPTRPRADLILKKGANHLIQEVALRKL